MPFISISLGALSAKEKRNLSGKSAGMDWEFAFLQWLSVYALLL
jgi:hypothetical protein